MTKELAKQRAKITLDLTEAGTPIGFDPNRIAKITSFAFDLPDTIEKVTVKIGGRTVEFDVNTFMDILEKFKREVK